VQCYQHLLCGSESKWFLAVTGAILPNTKSKIKQSLLFQNDTEIFTTIAQWINISTIFSGISCFAIQIQNLIKMMGHIFAGLFHGIIP